MIMFLLFILAGVGITNLVVNATILDYPRDLISARSDFFAKLLSCMMCSGFWIGMFIGIYFDINIIFSGAAISLLSYTFGLFIEFLEVAIAVNVIKLSDEGVEENEDD